MAFAKILHCQKEKVVQVKSLRAQISPPAARREVASFKFQNGFPMVPRQKYRIVFLVRVLHYLTAQYLYKVEKKNTM